MGKVLVQLGNHHVDNAAQIFIRQGVEDDDFIQPVDEFGIEEPLHFLHDGIFHLLSRRLFARSLEAQAGVLGQETRADIRRHDDDGVFEIDGIAETVGQMPVFKNLQ